MIALGGCVLLPAVAPAQSTMDFVVTVPANTPPEDSIYLVSGGAILPMVKIADRTWRLRITEEALVAAKPFYIPPQVFYAYSRAVDLVAFPAGEYFDDDPEQADWNIHRVTVFAPGSVRQDTVTRWRLFPSDGQVLPQVTPQPEGFQPRVDGAEFQAGIAIADYWPIYEADPAALIEATSDAIANSRATWVQLSPFWGYTQLFPSPLLQPASYTEAELRAHIRNLKAHGFKVALWIQICCEFPTPEETMHVEVAWWDAWFAQLANFIGFHARMATEEGVDALGLVLNEDPSLFVNAPLDRVQRWEAIAAQWRNAYGGPVGYQIFTLGPCCTYGPAAPYFNGGIADITHVFDYVGVSVWNGLADSTTPSQALLDVNAEALFVAAIDPIHADSHRPIVLSGLAYPSYDGGATGDMNPVIGNSIFFAEQNGPAAYDGIVQARVYQALLKAVAKRPHIIGMYPFNYTWNTMPLARDYSIRGKAAEPVVAAWYDKAALLTVPPGVTVTPGGELLDLGNESAVTLTIENAGGGLLQGTVSTAGAFTVTAGASVSLVAGARQTVTVMVTPNGLGLRAGNLTLTTNAGTRRWLLLAGAFTDAALQTMTTVVKLAHLLELRGLIDALRIRQGLAAFAWTDPSPVAGATPVKRQHLLELRAALAEVYVSAGRTPPTFSDPTVTAGVTPIKVSHLGELRSAAQALE